MAYLVAILFILSAVIFGTCNHYIIIKCTIHIIKMGLSHVHIAGM